LSQGNSDDLIIVFHKVCFNGLMVLDAHWSADPNSDARNPESASY